MTKEKPSPNIIRSGPIIEPASSPKTIERAWNFYILYSNPFYFISNKLKSLNKAMMAKEAMEDYE